MIRNMILAMALSIVPIAPAAAVITISATPVFTQAPPPPPAKRPVEPPAALRFGEIAAAGLGLLVVFLAFGTARSPHSVTA